MKQKSNLISDNQFPQNPANRRDYFYVEQDAITNPMPYDGNKKTPLWGAFLLLADGEGLSDSHLRHVGAMGPFRYV
ncbi:MAG: hypothetical protein IKK76_03445, partial [Alphaproteobacteria bacterium]|nr:hypothetical protein [Alphaproteobacteria bacterium]